MPHFMPARILFFMALLMFEAAADYQNAQAQTQLPIHLETLAEGLLAPVDGTNAGDGSGRMFITEQTGAIRIIQNGTLLDEPFLDVSGKMVRINSSYDERGLLGLAFHPQYAQNGRFFVYYSAPGGSGNHQSILAEYHVSSSNPNRADSSERVILTVDQPESNHNGGRLAFGVDGMLYVGLGDGGGAGDQHGSIGNGQNLDTLLGKILRIDVDGAQPYAIPPDNPFVNQDGRDEIWAYGLRNPWKFSFDFPTGRLFCADVGQNQWEEVNLITPGGNYGWRVMEGSHCYNPARNCDPTGKILPIAEYDHATGGISVTGGAVYRGQQFRSLYGHYLFADWSGRLYQLEETPSGAWAMSELAIGNKPSPFYVLSFAEDEQGELYILSNTTSSPSPNGNGRVFRLTVPGDEPVSVRDSLIY